jgi:regulatory protein
MSKVAKISAIKAQVKTPGRYSIFVEGKFVFGLSELGLINSGLRVGQEVFETKLEELKSNAQTDKMYNKALELIMRRPRSRWELEQYLKTKFYKDSPPKKENDVVAEVLELLMERGFVDDADFARRWVENRRLLKSISKRKLILELRQKRISDEIIQQVFSNDETDEREVLRAEIMKRRRQSRYQNDQKLIAYLARQGYNYDDIKQVMQSE